MITSQEELIKQMVNARSHGILVGRDNIVSAARLIVEDQAEVWRDVHGMLRVRRRLPEKVCSAERSLPADVDSSGA